MIRFVSFRSPTRGSPTRSSDPARRRDPSSITVTVAPPSDRASARRRVAPARDRRDATREKPQQRKRTSTATISRASGVRQNPRHWVNSLTRHKNRSVGHPCASPGVVARRRKPARAAMSSDEEEAPAPAMEHGEEARRRRRARAIDARAEAREPRARANDGRGTRARARSGARRTTRDDGGRGTGRDGRGRPEDDDDANDGIAMMGTDGARRANRAGFGAGADGERGGRGGAFEGDARARGGEGDEITARSMRLTTMRARWWMFGFTVEDDAV